MSKYRRLDTGESVAADDPERGIWYSAGCGYWTDDWSQLSCFGAGIPCCPHCNCPGMQTTAREWFVVLPEFLRSHPRYDEWLPISDKHCSRADNISFMEAYEMWRDSGMRGE